jgi:hypothetical protein
MKTGGEFRQPEVKFTTPLAVSCRSALPHWAGDPVIAIWVNTSCPAVPANDTTACSPGLASATEARVPFTLVVPDWSGALFTPTVMVPVYPPVASTGSATIS